MKNKSKKIKSIIVLLVVFGLLSGTVFSLLMDRGWRQNKNKDAIPYNIGGKEYYLLVADEPVSWATGLMNYRKPVDFDGMLFVFSDKSHRTFWNKNTYLDLDVYWIDNEKIVGKSFLPSIETSKEVVSVSSPVPVDKVVELIK